MKRFKKWLEQMINRYQVGSRSAASNSNIATAYDVTEVEVIVPMQISHAGMRFIMEFEDMRLKSYDDGAGTWTIGYGTTIYPNGVRVKRGETCTESEAKAYFQHDLLRFQRTVNHLVNVSLKQYQFDALVSLTYNIGENAFRTSTLLKYLNMGKYSAAAEQFEVWNKAGGNVMRGLVRRRHAEKELFLK